MTLIGFTSYSEGFTMVTLNSNITLYKIYMTMYMVTIFSLFFSLLIWRCFTVFL